MRFFRVMDKQKATRIRNWGRREARTASIMRILLTATFLIALGVGWFTNEAVFWTILPIMFFVGFYWLWYQLLPRIEQRREREEEQEELDFITLLHKYVDANSLEGFLENLATRVDQLEKKVK